MEKKDIVDVSMEEDTNNNNNQQHQTTHEQSSKKNKESRKRDEPIDVKVETINGSSDESLPLIGYNPEKCQRAEEPKVRVLRNMERHNWVVTPKQSSQMHFIGTNNSGEGAVPQIFRLEPNFGDQENTVDGTSKEVENKFTFEDIELEFKAEYNFLIKEFELAAKKDSKVDVEVGATIASARNIPPHDMSATTPEQAYPLQKIINKGEWIHLLDVMVLLEQGEKIMPEEYPVFVCNRIHKIDEAKDGKAKEILMCIFSYMNHLIKFKESHSMDDFLCAKYQYMPNIFTQKFDDMFGNQESKGLAGDKRDLLISYVLMLTLFVDNFKTDFTDIAKDLRMSSGDLRRHFEVLGCQFVRENSVILATLSVPLKFPEVG